MTQPTPPDPGAMRTPVRPRETFFDAVVIRADGTRVDLGRLAFTSRNPFRRLWWHLIGGPAARRRVRNFNATTREG